MEVISFVDFVTGFMGRSVFLVSCVYSMQVSAGSNVTAYAKLNASFSVVDAPVAPDVDVHSDNTRYSRYNNHASRVGVRGGIEGVWLDEVFTVIEYGMNFDSGKEKTFPLRDAYIGFKEGMTSVIVGQMNTPTKLAQGSVDQFNDVLDMKSLIAGENNGDMAVATIDGGQLSLAVASVHDKSFTEGGLGRGWSTSIAWKGKEYYWSVSGDYDIKNTDSVRALIGGNYVRWMWAGLWQTSKFRRAGLEYEDAGLISAGVRYKKSLYKVQAIHSDMTDTVKGFLGVKGKGTDMISIGLDYSYSKEGVFYVYSGYVVNSDDKAYSIGLGATYQF